MSVDITSGDFDSINMDNRSTDPTTPAADSASYYAKDKQPYFINEDGTVYGLLVGEFERSWAFASPAVSNGTFYVGGYYLFSGANNDFSPAINYGTANSSYAAHFMIVTGDTFVDEVTITVTGTSITDAGVRSAADTDTITVPNSTAADAYFETSKKFIGQVAVETTAGTAKQCNYGWCKYWDSSNTDFTVTGCEATWLAGATDASVNISLLHHKSTGWTYNAGADPTPPTAIANLQTDHNTEYSTINNEPGAWKRANLSTTVDGSGSEGVLFQIVTTVNKAFEPGMCTAMVRVIRS